MLRLFAALVFLSMTSGRFAFGAGQSDGDMVGTWKANPSTYAVIVRGLDVTPDLSGRALVIDRTGSHVATNITSWRIAGPPQSMPTNLSAFVLVLSKDYSFSATNVPAGLFGRAAMPYSSGTWFVGSEELCLTCRPPFHGFVTLPWDRNGVSPPEQIRLRVFMDERLGASGNSEFFLHKVAQSVPHGVPKQAANPNGELGGAANGRQPFGSETNRTSAAAAPPSLTMLVSLLRHCHD